MLNSPEIAAPGDVRLVMSSLSRADAAAHERIARLQQAAAPPGKAVVMASIMRTEMDCST
jgi:hypothetical protein